MFIVQHVLQPTAESLDVCSRSSMFLVQAEISLVDCILSVFFLHSMLNVGIFAEWDKLYDTSFHFCL